jgi:hypothetical protein
MIWKVYRLKQPPSPNLRLYPDIYLCISDHLCLCSTTRRSGGPGRVGVGLTETEKENTSVLFLVRVRTF